MENLKNDLKEIFTFFLDSYLSMKLTSSGEEYKVNKNKYSSEGEKMIIDLINDYFQFCENLIKKNYKLILEEKIKILTDKLHNEQTNFNIINKNTIEMKSKDVIQLEISPKIEEILKNKSNIYYLKNAFKVFLDILKRLIPFCFSIFYDNNITRLQTEDEEIKEMVIKNIRIQFEELEEKIKKYNEEIKEKRRKELEEKQKMKEDENGMEMSDEMLEFLKKNKGKKK